MSSRLFEVFKDAFLLQRSGQPILKWLAISLVLVFSCAYGSYGAETTVSLGRDTEKVTLQLKWYHQFQFAGYYAAQIKGYYRDEGLEVTILPGDAEHPPIRQVMSGQADFGVSDADVLTAYLRGQPLVVLAAIFQHSPYVLMTRADSGIRTPSDLRGRSIMLSDEQGIAQLKAMFRREGMSLDAVRVVPHQWDNQVLIDGRVDAISAYSTVEPYQLRDQGVEPGMIRAMDYGVDFYGDTLFTTRNQIERHPERVAAFRRASLRGWEYAMAHPEEMVDYISRLPGVAERGVTPAMLRYEAQAMRDLILPGLVDMGHMNAGRWETIARIYAEIGMVPRKPAPGALDPFIYDPDESANTSLLVPVLITLAIVAFVGTWVLVWNLHLRRAVARRTTRLQRAEQELRYHVENSPLAVVEWDSEYRVTRWTGAAERLFGWKFYEVFGKRPNEWRFIHQDDVGAVESVMARLRSGEQRRNMSPNRNYCKDGSVVHCEWYNSALVNERGQIVSILSLVLDVTARKRAEEAVRESQERLAEANVELEKRVQERTAKLRETIGELEHFSYTITHDMRAPLRAMHGFGTLLAEDYTKCLDDTGRDFLRRIIESAHRMDHLIQDALNYSKVVQSEMALVPVNPGVLLRGMVETYPEFQPPRAEIEVAENFPLVLANQAGLTQCFSNLLSNAVKFVSPDVKPRVRVWAEERGNTVRLWFEDNGIGIVPEQQERIFGMFQRLSKAYEGTGIGLALVRKVVERMRGVVGVESTPGQGSRFWIELAAAHPQQHHHHRSPSNPAPHHKSSNEAYSLRRG